MLSGIGPADHLQAFGIEVRADLPVGDYLQNHPASSIILTIRDEYTNLIKYGDQSLSIENLYQYYILHTGNLTKNYAGIAYLNTLSNKELEWPNAAYQARVQIFANTLDENRYWKFGQRKEEWDKYFADHYGKFTFSFEGFLQRVRSHGFVRLRSKNPLVHPIINPKFLTHPQDFEDFVELMKFIFFFYERSSINSYVLPHKPIPGCQFCPNSKYIYECDSYIRCYIIQFTYTGYHPVGTCRMGDPRRPDTVVDPRLRVKGIDRLRVCDASVMPSIPNGNTNAASIMIGEKCSDLIKQYQT